MTGQMNFYINQPLQLSHILDGSIEQVDVAVDLNRSLTEGSADSLDLQLAHQQQHRLAQLIHQADVKAQRMELSFIYRSITTVYKPCSCFLGTTV
jgi:hypothetical protein